MTPPARWWLPAAAAVLGACAHAPAPPDWQLNAKLFADRAVEAYLEGDSRLEGQDFDKARSELARTGRIDLMARAELMRCAAHVASLVLEPCDAFEKLRDRSDAPERAYADYLQGRLDSKDAGLLPPAQRAVASAGSGAASSALKSMDHPLSSLVGAAVLFRTGRADPSVIAMAVDLASSQGWRRPLLAWLNVQLELARRAGDTVEIGRLSARIGLVQGGS